MSACGEIVWGAEKAQRMDEFVERCTGHPCPGTTGGDCPALPRSTSSITKQHQWHAMVAAFAQEEAAKV